MVRDRRRRRARRAPGRARLCALQQRRRAATPTCSARAARPSRRDPAAGNANVDGRALGKGYARQIVIRVTDKQSGAPVHGAKVSVQGTMDCPHFMPLYQKNLRETADGHLQGRLPADHAGALDLQRRRSQQAERLDDRFVPGHAQRSAAEQACCYPRARPQSRPCAALPAAGLDCGLRIRRTTFDPDEGSKAGDHRTPRAVATKTRARPRCRSRCSPQRINELTEHLRDAPEGPLLAPRPAEAGRAATPVPELPPAQERRGIPRIDQGARPKALAPHPQEGGSLRELRRARSCLKPPLSTKKWRTDEHDDGKPRHGLGDRRRARDDLRDREAGQAGRRRRRRPLRRHDGARDRRRADGGARRRRLLPAHGRRRGAHVRRREDPRRLLQARRTAHRARDPDRADDRPPDPAALAEGLQERGARASRRRCRPTSSPRTTSSASTAPRPR